MIAHRLTSRSLSETAVRVPSLSIRPCCSSIPLMEAEAAPALAVQGEVAEWLGVVGVEGVPRCCFQSMRSSQTDEISN